jgi:hypothetical protein
MHQQLWGYKVEWKSVSRGTGGKKVEYHWTRRLGGLQSRSGHVSKRKNSQLQLGIEPRSSDSPARSQRPYRLSYPVSYRNTVRCHDPEDWNLMSVSSVCHCTYDLVWIEDENGPRGGLDVSVKTEIPVSARIRITRSLLPVYYLRGLSTSFYYLVDSN